MKPETVRAALIYMVNAFGCGFSGVSEALVRLLLNKIKSDEMPEIDASGSVGASDLVPLAQIAHWLLSSDEARSSGLPGAKEAISLINSNAISLSIGAEQLVETEQLLSTFDLTAAVSIEGFRGNPWAVSEQANASHRRKGQAKSTMAMRDNLAKSELWQAGKPRFLQDPLSFRCASQVHGTAWEAYSRALDIWKVELNSVHDNPIIDVDAQTAGYALHSVHDLNRLVDAAWKIVTVEMIISVWVILRRRLDIKSLGERVRHVVERLQPMLPIHVEGEEIFQLGPIVDLVRSGELLGCPRS